MKGSSESCGDVVCVCRKNPHYYFYRGKPVLLITSAEHYGAVINRGFDYISYFDELHKYGLNYTRIYPGIYREFKDMFVTGNTLATEPGQAVLPWARSDESGCGDGGNKFDLDRWNDSYFLRLKDFILEAQKRDIVVELCFFNCQYPESWSMCPLNASNNIQGIGNCEHNDAQTLGHKDLLEAEIAYVRKLVEEVNGFGNVILEICDEPTLKGTPAALAVEWIGRIADEIIRTEDRLPNKHLIAQQLEVNVDFTADKRIPVIVTQYIRHNETLQVGGIEALESEYAHNKPIELNETAYYPVWYHGDKIAGSRVEAWEFILGGGAAYNHLNGLFTVENPTGACEDGHRMMAALTNLKRFMEGFAFDRMHRDAGFVRGGIPAGALATGICEPGRQYALYLHHSVLKPGALAYEVIPGDYSAAPELELPEGIYAAQWVQPERGLTLHAESFDHAGGTVRLQSPRYALDIALGIKRILS